jgi:drug/metabolite transporter (DMT)-like permease
LNIKPSGYWFIAIVVSVIGAVCFSTKAIFVKLAYREGAVDPIVLLAWRMILSLPFFVGAAYFTSQKKSNVKFTDRQWAYVVMIGCLGYYVSSYLDFIGLQFVSAGMERLILFTYPTFVLLISAFWFKQRVSTRQIVAVLLTYAGLLFAFLSEASINFSTPNFYFGSACILLCALTYGTYIAASGRLIPTIGSVKFNSYAMSAACAGVLLHYAFTNTTSLFALPPTVYTYAVLMAIVSTVIPTYLVAISLNRLGANNTAIISSIGPISTILQAYYFLNEKVTILQWIGTIIIVVGILMISWRPKTPELV